MSRSSAICLGLLLLGIVLYWYAPRLSTRHFDEGSIVNEHLFDILVFLARLLCVFAAAVFGGLWIKGGQRD